jgi:outer membrane receptor for monomeric catechols
MYKFNKQFTGRVNGGLGYKIPVQFSYLDPETDLQNFVATELKPERSQGINADINYNRYFSDDLSLTLNQAFFYTNILRPVIDSVDASGVKFLENAGKPLTTKGLQTYLRLNYKDLEFYLGYVFTDVRKKYDPVHQTPYTIPEHQFSTTFFYDLTKNFVFGIESTYLAGQLNENYHKTKDYLLLAAMVRYSFKRFDVVLNGENLLDFRQSKYEQIYSGAINNPVFHKLWAPIDGRVINLSVKWTIE